MITRKLQWEHSERLNQWTSKPVGPYAFIHFTLKETGKQDENGETLWTAGVSYGHTGFTRFWRVTKSATLLTAKWLCQIWHNQQVKSFSPIKYDHRNAKIHISSSDRTNRAKFFSGMRT